MLNKIRYWNFEGNEGTGKTVLSKAFAEQCSAYWTYEPNADTEELKLLRELALNSTKYMTPLSRELCLQANRNTHHKVHLDPLISGKETVISDRGILSGMVYAKLEGAFNFEDWWKLTTQSGIHILPDVIIYCTSNKRKMKKNKEDRENDRYDNASKEVILQIDDLFEEALVFLKEYKLTKNIPIIRFENDFNNPAQVNLMRLVSLLKETLLK